MFFQSTFLQVNSIKAIVPQYLKFYINFTSSNWNILTPCTSYCITRKDFMLNKYIMNNQIINPCFQTCSISSKYLDHSKVPKLNEEDLEEQFVRGSGPGGQATNKTNNAVTLKHKPTGLVVKCHETRSLSTNRKRAREIMIRRLDNLLNGKQSIENQEHAIQKKISADKQRKQKKLAELKKAFKERENLV